MDDGISQTRMAELADMSLQAARVHITRLLAAEFLERLSYRAIGEGSWRHKRMEEKRKLLRTPRINYNQNCQVPH